ncbi:toxin-antitoxin system YwqK family antitoxin [Mucilaginibacter segetis]|uniref:MORN repeat protein n=1 Tax=Mucilaginibacter segetis TaxID=2793071 RepID=A0A934UP25_9SPHI|nr:hypothetical protein [Mucilaginibacter segetis]MBK0380994.1 hypothetical protein [Mucilaginibacter segetis]
MLKKYILFFTTILLLNNCFAQEKVETEERKEKITDNVREIFNVLKSDGYTRQGLYQALYKRKTPVASGMYDHGKKIGLWRFFDPDGKILETYNYTAGKMYYEAKEDTTSYIRYFVDKELDSTDVVTKPIKIGGRYYGYLPYIRYFVIPSDFVFYSKDLFSAVVELLISPGGRLADYKVHLVAPGVDKAINMNLNFPNEEDKIFTPATLNGQPIASRIMIRCVIKGNDHIDFDR